MDDRTAADTPRTPVRMKKRFWYMCIFVGAVFVLLLNVKLRQPQQQCLQEQCLLVMPHTVKKPSPVIPRGIRCYGEPSTNDSFPALDAQREEGLLTSRKNIFFLETSCFKENGGYAKLNYRQACSVESAARMNPNASVNLFYLSPAAPSNLTKLLIECLHHYDNVHISRVKAADYIRNTPIEGWYANGAVLSTSYWPNVHMSDFLRLLTLWKYGGIYLDLDVVVTTPLDNLTDFVGVQSEEVPNTAVLGLSRTDLGSKVARQCLLKLMETYHGDSWDGSSCGVMTMVTKELCHAEQLKGVTPERCEGFQVYPSSVFYPVHWSAHQQFFSANNSGDTMKMINAGRAVHMWNALTKDTKVVEGSPYALLAEKYCPVVFSHCKDEF